MAIFIENRSIFVMENFRILLFGPWKVLKNRVGKSA